MSLFDVTSMSSQELASWVQAIGSIVAILVSAAIAVAVPAVMRFYEERDLTNRALMGAQAVTHLAISACDSLVAAIERNYVVDGTDELYLGEIAEIAAVAAQVDRTRLGPNALMDLQIALGKANALRLIVKSLNVSKPNDHWAKAASAHSAALDEILTSLGDMRAIRLQGLWLADRPKFWKEH